MLLGSIYHPHVALISIPYRLVLFNPTPIHYSPHHIPPLFHTSISNFNYSLSFRWHVFFHPSLFIHHIFLKKTLFSHHIPQLFTNSNTSIQIFTIHPTSFHQPIRDYLLFSFFISFSIWSPQIMAPSRFALSPEVNLDLALTAHLSWP
jgi:hypothetical protein